MGRNSREISRQGDPDVPAFSPDARIHEATVWRHLGDSQYHFKLINMDAGLQVFGPAPGTPGMIKGEKCFAFMSIEGQWFLINPTRVP